MLNPFKGKKAKIQRAEEAAAAHTGHEVAESNHSTKDYGLLILDNGHPDAPVDIVLVHGITGNRLTTWSIPSTPPFIWAQSLLPTDVSGARIATWGYDADVLNFLSHTSRNRVDEHAANLLSAVSNWRERSDTTHRPIIFIAHSLGGIVVQDALLKSWISAESHLRNLLPSTVGIAFLGTPHRGSDLTVWAKSLARLGSAALNREHAELIDSLKPGSEVLSRIERHFWGLVRRRNEGEPELGGKLGIACFYEELATRIVGLVVDKSSATQHGYLSIGIRKEHADLGKFDSASDAGYVSLMHEVRRWVPKPGNGTAAGATMVLPFRGIPGSSAPVIATAPSFEGSWHDTRAEMEAPTGVRESARPPYFSSTSAPALPRQTQPSPRRSPGRDERQYLEAGYGAYTVQGGSPAELPSRGVQTPRGFGGMEGRPGTAPPSHDPHRRDRLPTSGYQQCGSQEQRVREEEEEEDEDEDDGYPASYGNRQRPQPTVMELPDGTKVTQFGSTYRNYNVTGNAKVIQGNVYGGGGTFHFN